MARVAAVDASGEGGAADASNTLARTNKTSSSLVVQKSRMPEIGTSGLNPTECSGPPHLLGPWGSAGPGAMGVASSKTSLPAGHLLP